MKRLINGEELATVIDDLTGRQDVRSSDGAMGNWMRCFETILTF